MFNSANDMMAAHEDYGNSYYFGKVINNNDPLGNMRIQADVPGVYDSSLGEVPWIGALKDSPFGFGSGFGVYGCPAVGSTVIVELQGGDEHKPLYRTLPTAPNANPNFNSPNLWGFQDPAGNMMIFNIQTKTYSMIFANGSRVDIDGSGNRTTKMGNDTENCNNWTINVSGNATIKPTGNFDMEAGGTATYKASSHSFVGPVSGNSTISAGGDITDNTNSGNGKTVANMRQVYDTHTHPYDDGTTGTPNQPI